ncbi:MAG TPA: amino acid permease [Vicinamibacteria bacterium]|nr:amino acid permease [Vicinamibacteria bacterium]
MTSISTILGAILFLRFGYAVGNVGFLGTLLIIAVGHMVTIPTAMAISEIATNQRVEGGGEYFIISRSFGIIIGAAIGVALFLARAISVAFYVIAFGAAFEPLFSWLQTRGFALDDLRLVSVPAVVGLTVLIVKKGADLGMKTLYVVVATLFLSLAMFFLGDSGYEVERGFGTLIRTIELPDPLFLVFAITFPAFTGMTAGVGLSGDLENPRKSIPLGTMAATLGGMVVYVLVAYKLALSAPPDVLVSDQLVMSRIALWGPIVPIGLAAAALSSAIGSYLVAPRTLQAIASDKVFPWPRVNAWLSRAKDGSKEPVNAALVTAAIAVTFTIAGDIDFVAQIISMFFMITYGSICSISFLEHFAADPAYRPGFRSRWYVSLFGALMCLWLMFQMSQFYALVAIAVMFVLYATISHYNPEKRGLSNIVEGAIFQVSRKLQVFLQKSRRQEQNGFRPSVVCISKDSFERHAAFDLLRWIAHRYGFGTFIHHIEGYLSRSTDAEARAAKSRLVQLAHYSDSNVYVDTIVSPSYRTAICQLIQLPGVSGQENNLVLFEFAKRKAEGLDAIIDNYQLVTSTGFDVCILASSDRGFGYRREVSIVLSPGDFENANLMILLAYILVGHPDWRGAVIKMFSVIPERHLEEEQARLYRLIRTGRLPISAHNVRVIPQEKGIDRRTIITERCRDTDLIIVGFDGKLLKKQRDTMFQGYDDVGNVLFVNTTKEIELVGDDVPEQEAAAPQTPSETKPQLAPS